jgi:solute carrier family 40 (iron-regulated transporter), member 1
VRLPRWTPQRIHSDVLTLRPTSSWSYRCAEFAFPLYFVQLFTNTLLPVSLYGFITTGAGIFFSNHVASLVDRFSHRKVLTAQCFVTCQKALAAASYALFLVLFSSGTLTRNAANNGKGVGPGNSPHADVWSIFASITLLGCLLM